MKKQTIGFLVAVALSLTLVACEWESGGDGVTDRYNFISFSGVYRGVNGGLLVTDYSSELDVADGSYSNFLESPLTTIARGNPPNKVFAGTVNPGEGITPGTFLVSAPARVFTDNGLGLLIGNPDPTNYTGTIDYQTGAWTLKFLVAPGEGTQINAKYQYKTITPAEDASGSGPLGNASSGASGISIFSFSLEHYGNDVTLTDNNGSIYKGKLGDIRSTGGVDQDNVAASASISPGDTFNATFSVRGTSAAGKQVEIAGTLQAVVQSAVGTSAVLTDRKILGTWIEANGRTGNVNGAAGNASVVLPTVVPAASTNTPPAT